jgi:hypothetical protein
VGYLLFYQSYDHALGDVSVGRWREIQRLLPPFIEYVNSAMMLNWDPATRRNPTVYADGTMLPPETDDNEKPAVNPFVLTLFIRDESDGLNEIYVEDACELLRMRLCIRPLSKRCSPALVELKPSRPVWTPNKKIQPSWRRRFITWQVNHANRLIFDVR